MVRFSQWNGRMRKSGWASSALALVLLIGLVAGVGCGEVDDEEAISPVTTQQQAMDRHSSREGAGAERGHSALPEAARERRDIAREHVESVQTKAQWDVHAQSSSDGSSITASWPAQPGETFTLCWKKTSDSGTVCGNNKVEDIVAQGSNYSYGQLYKGFETECGGVEYKIRVKRSFVSFRTTTETTAACDTAKACPAGGWFDGANCQIGKAPAGTSAFIYNGAYYYTYSNGATKCPLAGSHDDGANCFVQWIPSGVSPFIYLNHWYYEAHP